MNPQAFRHTVLSRTRIPFRHPRLVRCAGLGPLQILNRTGQQFRICPEPGHFPDAPPVCRASLYQWRKVSFKSCLGIKVRCAGLEPATFSLRGNCSTIELAAPYILARLGRLERPTYGFEGHRSNPTELQAHFMFFL